MIFHSDIWRTMTESLTDIGRTKELKLMIIYDDDDDNHSNNIDDDNR